MKFVSSTALFVLLVLVPVFGVDPPPAPTPAKDDCEPKKTCVDCTKGNTNVNKTCVWDMESVEAGTCVLSNKTSITEFTKGIIWNPTECKDEPKTTTPPPTNTTTTSTTTPATTTSTTTPSSSNTTTTTTTTTTPSTPTTTKPASNTTTTVSPTPAPTTSAAPITTAAPHTADDHGFAWGTFFGGMIFTLIVAGISFGGFTFYKKRQERNLHTLLYSSM